MKEQIAELQGRHRRNNLQFMGIKEKSGVESEKWEESEVKVKVFLQDKLGLETEEIIIERVHRIGKKEEEKRRTVIAKFLNYKQREKVLNKYKELKLWEDQIYINEDFCLNVQRKLGKEGSLPKLFITGLFRFKFDMLLLFKM